MLWTFSARKLDDVQEIEEVGIQPHKIVSEPSLAGLCSAKAIENLQ